MSSYMDPGILEYLRAHPEGATASEIAEDVFGQDGIFTPTSRRGAVWKRCQRLADSGALIKTITYRQTAGGRMRACLWRLALWGRGDANQRI